MKVSQKLVYEKLRRYCNYQDRCHQEVRTKILALKIYGDDLEEIIAELIREDYLNEERYARSYTRGKFRMKKWGRNKILYQLKAKRVSDYCIKKGLEEINEEEYQDTLQKLMDKQLEKHASKGSLIAKDKTIKYAISRGYETNLVFSTIRKLEKKN